MTRAAYKAQLAQASRLGSTLIAVERERHASKGYDAAHDAEHIPATLLCAAAIYALHAAQQLAGEATDAVPKDWPFEPEAFKPTPNPLVTLAKAGSLIAAEIDRIARQHPELLG